jgi:hypothetical protein
MTQSRFKPPPIKYSKRWYKSKKMTFDKSINKKHKYLKNWRKRNEQPTTQKIHKNQNKHVKK